MSRQYKRTPKEKWQIVRVSLMAMAVLLVAATLVLLGLAVFDETPLEAAKSDSVGYVGSGAAMSDYFLLAVVTAIGAIVSSIFAAIAGDQQRSLR
jgi:hypothetical protein